MKNFRVNVSFAKKEKCSVFGFDTQAESKKGLREVAIAWARENGYKGTIKSVKIDFFMPRP